MSLASLTVKAVEAVEAVAVEALKARLPSFTFRARRAAEPK